MLDPKSIFHPYYLLSAFTIALLWLLNQGNSFRKSLSLLCSRHVWFQQTTFTDLKFCLIHFFILKSAIAQVENHFFLSAFRFLTEIKMALMTPSIVWPATLEGLLATVISMVSIDFASYGVHRLMHSSPRLWSIHSVHHSAEQLTPLTTYRQHPLEPFLLYGARGLAAGIGLGLFYFIFPSQSPVITIYGMGVGFFFYMLTVNLHHLPIPVRYPRWLRSFLISPHIHHLHHSAHPQHHGYNYGVIFSFWDHWFKTYKDEELEPETLSFGLGKKNSFSHSLSKSLWFPLVSFLRITSHRRFLK